MSKLLPLGQNPAFDRWCEDIRVGNAPLVKTADDVDITINPHPTDVGQKHAVVRDSSRQRAWSGEGRSEGEAATEAMRKFLKDRRAKEYV